MHVNRRIGLLGLLGANIVGLARVYVGVHNALDIVGLAFLVHRAVTYEAHSQS